MDNTGQNFAYGGYYDHGSQNNMPGSTAVPTYDSSMAAYASHEETRAFISDTSSSTQFEPEFELGITSGIRTELKTGAQAVTETAVELQPSDTVSVAAAAAAETVGTVKDYSDHMNQPQLTWTGTSFHYGECLLDTDDKKFMLDDDFRRQTFLASQLNLGEVQKSYPKVFRNNEKFKFTEAENALLGEFPLASHGQQYEDGEPGAVRTAFNRDNPDEAIYISHDTLGQERKEKERRRKLKEKKDKAEKDLQSIQRTIQATDRKIRLESNPSKKKKLEAARSTQCKHMQSIAQKIDDAEKKLRMPPVERNAPFQQGWAIPNDPLSPLASMTPEDPFDPPPYDESLGCYVTKCAYCQKMSYIYSHGKAVNNCTCQGDSTT